MTVECMSDFAERWRERTVLRHTIFFSYVLRHPAALLMFASVTDEVLAWSC